MSTATHPTLSNPKSETFVPSSGRGIRNPRFSLQWDSRLVEEAVFRAVQARKVDGFRAQRDRVYEIEDPEERDAAFREFHASWFEGLGLGRVIWQALEEQPLIPENTRTCIVARARAGRDEGAELFVSSTGEGVGELEGRWVGIHLDPQRIIDPGNLLVFLRHELLHIADMLDPDFGYHPRLPQAEAGPAHERLLQDRYRVLWDAFIDGRIMRRGRAPASVRDRRLDEFTRSFPMLGEGVGEAFARFFDTDSLTHADLVAFAVNPLALPASVLGLCSSNPKSEIRNPKSLEGPRSHAGQRCPLCGFPTHSFEPNPDQLPAKVVDQIRADFSTWTPSRGLCQQCSDLYQSRSQLRTPAF